MQLTGLFATVYVLPIVQQTASGVLHLPRSAVLALIPVRWACVRFYAA